jgi:hypothetical protein
VKFSSSRNQDCVYHVWRKRDEHGTSTGPDKVNLNVQELVSFSPSVYFLFKGTQSDNQRLSTIDLMRLFTLDSFLVGLASNFARGIHLRVWPW